MLRPLDFIRFENEALNLYGTLHRPEGDGPFPVVVFCHGFTGHRIEASHLFAKVRPRLARAGIAAFRFDCRGSGESDGEFRDMTISTEISDAMRAVDVVASCPEIDPGRMGMLGFSMGGTVAAETAARRRDIRSLCLWSPVSDPCRQFAETASRMTGETVDLGPMVLGRGFVEDLPNHQPTEAARRWGGPLRVLHGTADLSVALDSGKAYVAGPGRRDIVIVDGADHAWLGADRQERLFDGTVGWFRETL